MPGPGLGVGVGDAAGREVDAIPTRDPVDGRVELDGIKRERAGSLLLAVLEPPHQHMGVIDNGADVRITAPDVKKNAIAERVAIRRGIPLRKTPLSAIASCMTSGAVRRTSAPLSMTPMCWCGSSRTASRREPARPFP